jgi:hypothetical protein
MWTSIAPFYEAENAYRRERILATFPTHSSRPPRRLSNLRSGWVSRPAHHGRGHSLRSLRSHIA